MTAASIYWHSAGMDSVSDDPTWVDGALAARLAGMRYAKRRQEARLGRWTAKNAVALALGLPTDPHSLGGILIRNAPDGAPETYLEGRTAPVHIAMTDRADWAVAAVTHDGVAIGCDLELVEYRSAAFVRDYFTPGEQQWVASQRDHSLAANLIWSAKESALKVLRTGLRRDTRTVEVSVGYVDHGGWRPLTISDHHGGVFAGWWVRHGEFVLTCAAATRALHPPVAMVTPPPLAAATPSHQWMSAPLDTP